MTSYPRRMADLRTSSLDPKTKFVKLMSINYDFMPSSLEMPRMFWADLVDLPPPDLKIGTHVKVHIPSSVSTLLNSTINQLLFRVEDISGTRVVLSPISKIQTGLYGELEEFNYPFIKSPSPMGWGNETTYPPATSLHPNYTNVKYGFGVPSAVLEYVNPYYKTW